jgi:hypothetical protein
MKDNCFLLPSLLLSLLELLKFFIGHHIDGGGRTDSSVINNVGIASGKEVHPTDFYSN